MSLDEYLVDRLQAVLLAFIEGREDGEQIPLGGGVRFAGEAAWRRLSGSVDARGVWRWDGQPSSEIGRPTAPTPRDPRSRAWRRWRPGFVVSIEAYEDKAHWHEVDPDWPIAIAPAGPRPVPSPGRERGALSLDKEGNAG